jgi:hypothetical protein
MCTAVHTKHKISVKSYTQPLCMTHKHLNIFRFHCSHTSALDVTDKIVLRDFYKWFELENEIIRASVTSPLKLCHFVLTGAPDNGVGVQCSRIIDRLVIEVRLSLVRGRHYCRDFFPPTQRSTRRSSRATSRVLLWLRHSTVESPSPGKTSFVWRLFEP